MAKMETRSENIPVQNLIYDSREDAPSSSIVRKRLIQLPLTFMKILFPSTIFLNFFISSLIPSLANILIPMFFTGNIPNGSGLAVNSQFMFISIVLKVIQEGVGNSLFHFVGTHYKTDKRLALSAFNLSLLVLIVSGLMLTVTILLFSRQFVELIDTPETISEVTQHFFYTSAFSFIPTLLTTAFMNYLLITTSLWLVVAQLVLVATTFLLNFFTFGQHSFSLYWGINELGIYTVVQSTVTMVVSIGFVLLVEGMGPVEFFRMKSETNVKRTFRTFFAVSWGNFADSIVRNFFYFFVTLKFINNLGEDESAAWNLFNGIIWGLILLPAFVVANYIRVRIGHNSSKSTIREVVKESGTCLLCWIIIMVIISGTVWSMLASFFSKSNQKVAHISENMFHDMGWVFIIFAYNNAVISYFQATGKTEYIFYQSLAANFVVYLPSWLLHLFGYLTPTYWLIMGLYIAGMLMSCCLTSYFGMIVWKSIPDT